MELIIRDVPFELGRAAHRRGLKRTACPYPAFMESAARWIKGWDSLVEEESVSDVRTWHGIPVRMRDAFMALADTGVPALEMSRQLTLPVDVVNACLKSLRLTERPIHWIKADTGWLTHECARLDALWSAGVALPDIRRELGRRKADVNKRLAEMMRPAWMHKERALLKDLVDQNLAIPEIALQLDRTSKSVETQVKRLEQLARYPGQSVPGYAASMNDVPAPAKRLDLTHAS